MPLMAVMIHTFLLMLHNPGQFFTTSDHLKIMIAKYVTAFYQTHEDCLREYLHFGLEKVDREVLERALLSYAPSLGISVASTSPFPRITSESPTKNSLTLDFTKEFS